MKIYTQFNNEKMFRLTSKKDALDLIQEEFKETDAEATLAYIISTCKEQKKVVTLGEIKFKVEI